MKHLIILAALAGAMAHAQVQTITDTCYTPFNELFTGTVVVTLNNPQNAQPLYTGSTTLTGGTKTYTVTNGACSFSLFATATMVPSGVSYSARFTPTTGSAWSETWVVGLGATTLPEIRSRTVPTPATMFTPSQITQAGAALNNVLRWNGSAWAPYASILTDPMTTTGDMIYRTGGVPSRLPIGSTGQVLTVTGGAPAWATNLAGNAATATLAASATALATPRTIAGVSFDGTASIDIPSTGLSDAAGYFSLTADEELLYRFNLRNWDSRLSGIYGGGTSTAIIAMIGDSWIENALISTPVRTELQSALGNGGLGFYDMNSLSGSGTWTQNANGSGPNGYSLSTSDSATPASKSGSFTCTRISIHYAQASGAGSFRYRIDGGSWTTVDANGATAYQVVTASGLSDAIHTIDIQLVSGTVTFYGVDARRTGVRGAIVHGLGHTGWTASDFAAIPSADFAAALVALAPDAVALTFGVNELQEDITPDSQAASLTTIVSRIRAAVPLADIVLVPPSDVGLSGDYTIAQYHARQSLLARTLGLSMVSPLKPIGAYADANTRGLYNGTGHLSSAGGTLFGSYVSNFLLRGKTSRSLDLTLSGALAATSATLSGLSTTGGVLFSGAGGSLTQSSAFTWGTGGESALRIGNSGAFNGIYFTPASSNSTFIDSRTIGAPIVFRLSNASAADTAPLQLNAAGTVRLGGYTATNGILTTSSIGLVQQSANGTLDSSGNLSVASVVSGAMALAVTSKTANYQLTNSDFTVSGDTSGGTFTITMPSSPRVGQVHVVKKTAAANTLTVSSSAGIDGPTFVNLTSQYQSLVLQYSGSTWQVIASHL